MCNIVWISLTAATFWLRKKDDYIMYHAGIEVGAPQQNALPKCFVK